MAKNSQMIVLGLGRFGQGITKTLIESGCDVLAADIDITRVQAVTQYATHVVRLDVTEENALDTLGLNNFDVAFVAISDLEASAMAVMKAKEKGVKTIIAKAKNQVQKTILENVGATRVVLPEKEMGVRVANSVLASSVIEYMALSEHISIAEIVPNEKWINKRIMDTNLRQEKGLNIVAIKKDDKITVTPEPTEIIDENTILVVIGQTKVVNSLGGSGLA